MRNKCIGFTSVYLYIFFHHFLVHLTWFKRFIQQLCRLKTIFRWYLCTNNSCREFIFLSSEWFFKILRKTYKHLSENSKNCRKRDFHPVNFSYLATTSKVMFLKTWYYQHYINDTLLHILQKFDDF